MRKVGIVTLNGNYNFGNKLQNYAVQTILENNNLDVKTIQYYYENKKIIYDIKSFIKFFIKPRYRNFCIFDKKIKYSKYYICNGINSKNLKEKFDCFFVGSDQVWNPTIGTSLDSYLLSFAESKQRNSISASFGISELPKQYEIKYKTELEKFNYISVREDAGADIIKKLDINKNVEVLIDPTMMLTTEEWDKVLKKPKKTPNKKYILNYFLGVISAERKKEIERIAKENDCEIINILDKNDPYYVYGPSEFLYLEKNAFLVCTDSFHSCVFAMLYNKPFVVFDRDQKEIISINSRIDTLISKFQLENRRFSGIISENNLKHDYSKAYKILENERKKMQKFINKAISK